MTDQPADSVLPPIPDPISVILHGGGIHLLAGASGTGKTAFIAGMALAFRDSLPFCGQQPNPLPAQGVLSLDRSWHVSGEWFARAGFPDIPHYALQDDRLFTKSRLVNRQPSSRVGILTDCLERLNLPPGALIYIDPISYFLGGKLIDYDTCMVGCSMIREVAQQYRYTFIGLAHASKQKSDPKDRYLRLQDRIMGSSAIYGYADTQMYLASPEECADRDGTPAPHYTFLWHPHLAPAQTFKLGRNPLGLFEDWVPADGYPQVQAAILTIMGDPERTPAEGIQLKTLWYELARLNIEVSKAAVSKHLDRLIEDGRVERCGYGRYRLTPSH